MGEEGREKGVGEEGREKGEGNTIQFRFSLVRVMHNFFFFNTFFPIIADEMQTM